LVLEKIEIDDEVDIFQVVRAMQIRRPEFFSNFVSFYYQKKIVIVNNSININYTNNSLSFQLNTTKQKQRHYVENLDTGLGYDIKMAVLNQLMGSQPSSLMFHQRYFKITNRQQIMQLQQKNKIKTNNTDKVI